MAAPADMSAIFAALAAQRAGGTPGQLTQGTNPQISQGFQLPQNTATPLSGFALPQPVNSGSLDLSAIKPVNTGSVSIADAIAKAKGIAAERSGRGDDRYRRSRSRSRSRSPPLRRDSYRDSFNPYRDERRDESRREGRNYRDRSRSPVSRGNFSPPRNARDRSPLDDNSEIIAMDSSLVGLVIGRQGENLRRVETDSKTRIQFITGPDGAGPQRQCRITGDLRARTDAKREINRIIDENGGNPVREISNARGMASSSRGTQSRATPLPVKEGDKSIQIMVPDRTVGLIIGRGGETIRDLQERSGCHVNIVGENKSVNGLRPVNLIGSPQAAGRAKELILEIVDSDTRALTNQGPTKDQLRMMNESFADSTDNKLTEKIMVPSEAVGMIIGKGGETIKLMQNDTGCKINVTPAAGADIQREIGLIGPPAAIEEAKRVIWNKVDTVVRRDKNAAAGRRNDGSANNFSNNDAYAQRTQSYAQPGIGQPNNTQPPPGTEAGNADPYAAWGGYQNYAAMWYAALAQQQQQQQPQQGQQQAQVQSTPGDQTTANYAPPGL